MGEESDGALHDVPAGERDDVPVGHGHGDFDVVKHERPIAASIEEMDIGEDDEDDSG